MAYLLAYLYTFESDSCVDNRKLVADRVCATEMALTVSSALNTLKLANRRAEDRLRTMSFDGNSDCFAAVDRTALDTIPLASRLCSHC